MASPRFNMLLRAILAGYGGAPAWSPLSWFAASEQGAWYDPTDLTRYMDVSASPELFPQGTLDSATGWNVGANTVISGGVATVTAQADGTNMLQFNALQPGIAWLQIAITVSGWTQGNLQVFQNDNATVLNGRNGVLVGYIQSRAASGSGLLLRPSGGAFTGVIETISIKQVSLISQATMYQDAAGTTPVTAVEQPVGLILDRRLGALGALGAELFVGGNWPAPVNGFSGSGSSVQCTSVAAFTAGYQSALTSPALAGRSYRISFVVSGYVSGNIQIQNLGEFRATANGSYSYIHTPVANQANLVLQAVVANTTLTISSFSVREVPGNHASQATSTARPTLRNRYNLLTFTEQFGNVAVWTANRVTFSGGVLTNTASTGDHDIYAVISLLAATYSLEWDVEPDQTGWVAVLLQTSDGTNRGCHFNLSAGTVGTAFNGAVGSISTVSGNRRRCRITVASPSAGTSYPMLCIATADGTGRPSYMGTTAQSVKVYSASLVSAADASLPYQRVTTATNYDSDPSKFPLYLAFDGSDDSMATSAIDFSATDEMTVVAGVTKLSDASIGMLLELSASSDSSNGVFRLMAPNAGGATTIAWRSKGDAVADAIANSAASPIKAVVSGAADVSADLAALRLNGVQVSTGSTDQGAGNYGNYPLFIGARNNASLRFNGRIHQLIIRGKTSADIAQAESFVAARTGVTL